MVKSNCVFSSATNHGNRVGEWAVVARAAVLHHLCERTFQIFASVITVHVKGLQSVQKMSQPFFLPLSMALAVLDATDGQRRPQRVRIVGASAAHEYLNTTASSDERSGSIGACSRASFASSNSVAEQNFVAHGRVPRSVHRCCKYNCVQVRAIQDQRTTLCQGVRNVGRLSNTVLTGSTVRGFHSDTECCDANAAVWRPSLCKALCSVGNQRSPIRRATHRR